MNQTWLDRIQINQAHRTTTELVEHHIVDFGISMNRAALQLAASTGSFQHIHTVASTFHEIKRTFQARIERQPLLNQLGLISANSVVMLEIARRDVETFEGVS